MSEDTATDLFRRWFVAPIEKLRELPGGDGGFVAFIAAFPLYERAIKARLKLAGKPQDEKSFQDELARDLQITDQNRRIFWDMFRNGLTHQAMLKVGDTGARFGSEFGPLPEFRREGSQVFVCIDPWKFVDRVLQMYQQDEQLIAASESYPLALIIPTEFESNVDRANSALLSTVRSAQPLPSTYGPGASSPGGGTVVLPSTWAPTDE